MFDAMRRAGRGTVVLTVGVAAMALPAFGAFAQSGADIYKGKTITIVVGTGAGGAYGISAQLLARYWPKRIPGEPAIIVQAMPGGGGMKMAGYLHNVAPPDGSVIGLAIQTVAMVQKLRPKEVKYDVRSWPWIGNMASLRQAIVVSPTAPARTFEDARKTETVIGATAKSGNLFMVPKMAKELAGANFKIVLGYRGGADLDKAMASGETHGRGGSWESWKLLYPDIMKRDKLVPLALTGFEPDPAAPGVPLLRDLASKPLDKQVIDFFSRSDLISRPYAAAPRTPRKIVEILRASFAATVMDPTMAAEAAKRRIAMSPTSWQVLEKTALETLDTPDEVVKHMEAILAR